MTDAFSSENRAFVNRAEDVTALQASIPCATHDVTIPRELFDFMMGTAPMQETWFGDMNDAYKGAFWWRALLACAERESAPPQETAT
jgi:hypothetical protein